MRCVILALLGACGGSDTISLFDGETLAGWYSWRPTYGRDVDPHEMFAVKDGAIHFLSKDLAPADFEFGYLATVDEYESFRVRFEYRWGQRKYVDFARDSGFFIAAVGPDMIWPRSIECQVMENDSGSLYLFDYATLETTIDPAIESPTYLEGGTPYTAPRNPNPNYARVTRATATDSLTDWNQVEIVVRGDETEFVVNGTTTFRGSARKQPNAATPDDPTTDIPLTRGRLVLQQEGAEVMFRALELEPL